MERFRLKRQQSPNPIIESKPEPPPDPDPNPHPGFENEQELDPPQNDDVAAEIPPPIPDNAVEDQKQEANFPLRPTMNEEEDPFMGLKLRRMASCVADYKGDYIDLPSRPPLLKILHKQGLVFDRKSKCKYSFISICSHISVIRTLFLLVACC